MTTEHDVKINAHLKSDTKSFNDDIAKSLKAAEKALNAEVRGNIAAADRVARENKRVADLKQKQIRETEIAIKRELEGEIRATERAAAVAKKAADAKLKSIHEIERAINRELDGEIRAGNRLKQIREREDRELAKEVHLIPGAKVGLGSMGHFAGGMGMYNVGHIMRGVGAMGIGAELSTAAIVGIGSAAIALGGVAVAAMLIKSAFEETAGSFLSAVGTIGKGRNLEAMLIEAAHTEKLSAIIAANTVGGNVSTKQVMTLIKSLSSNSIFNPEEIAEGTKGYRGKTGLPMDLGEYGSFFTNFAMVSEMSMRETGQFFGQLKSQFGLNPQEIKEVATNMWQQGLRGSAELQDAEKMAMALQYSENIAPGNSVRGISAEMGLFQMVNAQVQNPSETATRVKRLQEEMLQGKGRIPNILTKGPGRQLVFKNFSESFAELAYRAATEIGFKHTSGFEEKAFSSLTAGYKTAKANTPGFENLSPTQQKQAIYDVSSQFLDAKGALENFNHGLELVNDTVEVKLEKAFNRLANELEGPLLNVLRVLEPYVERFVDVLSDNKDQLAKDLQVIMTALFQFGMMLPNILTALTKFLQSTIENFYPNVHDSRLNAEEEAQQQREYLANLKWFRSEAQTKEKWNISEISTLDAKIAEATKNIIEQDKNVELYKSIESIQSVIDNPGGVGTTQEHFRIGGTSYAITQKSLLDRANEIALSQGHMEAPTAEDYAKATKETDTVVQQELKKQTALLAQVAKNTSKDSTGQPGAPVVPNRDPNGAH